MIRRFLVPLALAWVVLAALPAGAVMPDEQLDDPALEARAREISAGLRCVVCQSENIDGSNAELARDMRIRVRELLVEGKTNDEVVQYMVDRYGDYVLMKPPFKASTYFLWFGPALILVLGGLGLALYYRGRAASAPAAPTARAKGGPAPQPPALSEAERTRLADLMTEDDDSDDGAKDRKGPKA